MLGGKRWMKQYVLLLQVRKQWFSSIYISASEKIRFWAKLSDNPQNVRQKIDKIEFYKYFQSSNGYKFEKMYHDNRKSVLKVSLFIILIR